MVGNQTDGTPAALYFHATKEVTLLFKTWTTTSWAELIGSCLVIFFLSVLCESLRLVRRVVLGESLELDSDGQSLAGQMRRYGAVNNTTASGISLTEYTEFGMEPIDDGDQTEQSARLCHSLIQSSALVDTLLYVAELLIRYCLMMAFMTHNAYICLSVLAGATLGYALFRGSAAFASCQDTICKRLIQH